VGIPVVPVRAFFLNRQIWTGAWARRPEQIADAAGALVAPVNTPKPIADDPQFRDRFPWYAHERHGADMLPFPVRFLGEMLPEPSKAPTVGLRDQALLRGSASAAANLAVRDPIDRFEDPERRARGQPEERFRRQCRCRPREDPGPLVLTTRDLVGEEIADRGRLRHAVPVVPHRV